MRWRRSTLLMATLGSLAAALGVAWLACGASGCSSVGYLAQSVDGHMDLMRRARPVHEWVADGSTAPALRRKLESSQEMREFAVRDLRLPDNRSYRSYAELDRGAAVWNVVAAPELSLTLNTWCFPVLGCVGYRGYFDRSGADTLAAELRGAGLEVDVYGVPAYSTLGWTNWLGGDPLLSTFMSWPDAEVARLLFHELAHHVVYAPDDTAFNESFAVAVERIGGTRWLTAKADEAALREFRAHDQRRQEFRELTGRVRAALAALYAGPARDDEKRQRKAEIYSQLRAEHARLKAEHWGGFAGYDAWVARANNASLGVQGAYNDLVPGFERVFERSGGDFDRFYAEVRRLASLPKAERHATLRAP
jgi:predicted aminopeptidase